MRTLPTAATAESQENVMKKIIALVALAFALVAGTAAVTVQLAPPAHAGSPDCTTC
jgi:hypothetical protein